jgi:hypothetical protein
MAVADVQQIDALVLQSATASARIRSRAMSGRPFRTASVALTPADGILFAIVDPPFIDHVSLTARSAQIEELGFHLSPISDSESRGRILFDGSYFEVMPPDGPGGAGPGARHWVLRPADPHEAAEILRGKGIPAVGPDLYAGDDGTWLDVMIDSKTSVLPILTHRVDRPAHEWPPLRGADHLNGATRLSAVHLEARDSTQISRVLEALGARTKNGGTFELGGSGRVVVHKSQDGREGIVGIDLDRADRLPLRLQVNPAKPAERER